MIRKAVGTVISRMIVTATTNRTMARLSVRMSTMLPPNRAMTTTSGIVSASSSGMAVKKTFPGSVSRFQPLAMTVIGRSLVDAAHDRVEAGHDGHRVGHEMA